MLTRADQCVTGLAETLLACIKVHGLLGSHDNVRRAWVPWRYKLHRVEIVGSCVFA